MRKVLILTFITIALLLTSCRTTSPIGDQEYFQAMGRDGDLVITVNTGLLDTEKYLEGKDDNVRLITDRMERLSLALTPGPDTDLSDFSTYGFYGAIEGDYPKVIANLALTFSNLFSKTKDSATGFKYYVNQDAGLEIAVPEKGLILFSSSNIVNDYVSTYRMRETRIGDADAKRMASSQIGLFIAHPKTMVDLGFEVPQQALENISSIMLIMDDNLVSIEFTLMTEDLANQFSIIVRSSYVSSLRLEGKKVNVAELKEMFTIELNKVGVNNYELKQEQIDMIEKTITSLLDMIG